MVSDLKLAGEAEQPGTHVDVALIESNENITKIRYQIGEFSSERVQIGGLEYYRIVLVGEPNIMEKGMPDLPYICRSIIIPDNAEMEVRVTESKFSEYYMPVAPSKGFISRRVN
ncbi:MAG: hypothetical protein GTO24_21520, partial [candidate division Zixibacteria bacterium]|nr:hypothetical protein [candidate division Zixibacteria bacterium]